MKKILITGGNGSIGKAIAIHLSKKNKVFILDKVKKKNEKNIYNFQVNLSNFNSVKKILNKITADKKQLDIVINCVGNINNFSFINLNEKMLIKNYLNFKKVIQDHLFTTYLINMLVINQNFINRKKCIIINFSSISSQGNPGQSAYSSAKGAINSLTKTMSKELGPLGFKTNCISPGFIKTQSTKKSLNNNYLEKVKDKISLQKLGKEKDIIQTIDFIIKNNYLNGSIIKVDGGTII
jgi:3-oxoacyl-[acyl-carrier protein] reductase